MFWLRFGNQKFPAWAETLCPVLKKKMRGIYRRGDVFWLAKQVNGRRTFITLETSDYVEAVKRAQEIIDRPDLQPAQGFPAEIDRFLQHKLNTNRFSNASVETKGYVLRMFAERVGNVSPANVTSFQCKSFYDETRKRVSASTAEGYMFTLRSFFGWCVDQSLCRRNPALDMQLDSRGSERQSSFRQFELAQKLIEDAPNDDLRFVLFCGFHIGMRKLEIIEAVPEWFNFPARNLEIRATETFRPKDRDARTVPLTVFASRNHRSAIENELRGSPDGKPAPSENSTNVRLEMTTEENATDSKASPGSFSVPTFQCRTSGYVALNLTRPF